MLKSIKCRIYPTSKQTKILDQTLEICRNLYNALLEQREVTWNTEKKILSAYIQDKWITVQKEINFDLKLIHSQVLQNVAVRLDLAFKSFSRRLKNKENPGYPRFKAKNRYSSFTYPQSGFKIDKDNKLYLSKIGHIKIKLHQEVLKKVKTCTIIKSPTDKWYVCFCIEHNHLKPEWNPKTIGIDLGLINFITDSDGNFIPTPKFYRKDEKDLKRAHRKFSKEKSKKQHKILSRIYERIKFRRSNFTHQLSRSIINNFGTICIENLEINRMVHNHCLAKSILDASWTQFTQQLIYKAEEAGRKLIKVNPAYTSQDCSNCGHRTKLELKDRVYKCSCCNMVLDRDHNAARNILRLGLQSLDENS
jgi:putative transposase